MSAASESAVRIGLVYPELLGTYGDRGNAVVLVQRLRWRGHAAELVEVTAGAPIPESLDVYLFGGGEDDPQVMASAGMRSSRAAIDRGRAGGAVVVAGCAGVQLIGHSYQAADGPMIDGLGLADAVPRAGPDPLLRDLADLVDLLVRLVGVGALDLQKLFAGALGFGLGAVVGGGEPGLDAFGHDPLAFVDERVDHLRLGHHAHDLPLDEQVAFTPTGGNAEVRLSGLPRPVHDAAHHRDL